MSGGVSGAGILALYAAVEAYGAGGVLRVEGVASGVSGGRLVAAGGAKFAVLDTVDGYFWTSYTEDEVDDALGGEADTYDQLVDELANWLLEEGLAS